MKFFRPEDFKNVTSFWTREQLEGLANAANAKLEREGVRVYGNVIGEYRPDIKYSDTHQALLVGIEEFKPKIDNKKGLYKKAAELLRSWIEEDSKLPEDPEKELLLMIRDPVSMVKECEHWAMNVTMPLAMPGETASEYGYTKLFGVCRDCGKNLKVKWEAVE